LFCRLDPEPVARFALGLWKAEDRKPIWIAGIIGRAESSVVLFSGLVPEAGNPRATLRAAAIAERTPFRDHRPVGFRTKGQLRAGGSGVDLRVADGASH